MQQMDQIPAPPAAQPLPTRHPEKPNNNLWLAIFATLCCCVPTGIAAIVFAARVDGKYAGGDYQGAQEDADNAKLWSFISIGLGLVFTVIYVFGVMATGIQAH